jgi:hypothetical protein
MPEERQGQRRNKRREEERTGKTCVSGVALSFLKYAFVTSRSLVGQVILGDSAGSSLHIIPDKSLIRDYGEYSGYSIVIHDGRTLNSSGKGDLMMIWFPMLNT